MRGSETEGEDAQAPTLDWLKRTLAASTGQPVMRIDTQGAIVLLSGDEAWKLRRAIRLPFLDYFTPEKRRAAAEAEIRLNRPAAPDIYRDAVAITRADGGFAFNGSGETVDWITRMRRFDEEATLDRLAERGELTRETIGKLARAIFASHERAEIRDARSALDDLEDWIQQNRAAFGEHEDLFPPERAKQFDAASRAALDAVRPLLLARGAAGFCRRGHGDLHLKNIAVIAGEPTPFDAIEFDDAIATGDVLYDLAFALMDLWERDLCVEANALLSGYLTRGPEDNYAALAALPLFLSVRAAIRAKVEAGNRSHLSGEARAGVEAAARRYFDFAGRFLEPTGARLIAIGGLSGSGKSALARALLPDIGRAPGAVWLSSDIERKHMLGREEAETLPDAAYDLATSTAVYERIRRRVAFALRAGHSAVIDMTHSTGGARRESAELAAACGVPFLGLWLELPLASRLQRVDGRHGDASDADVDIAERQHAEPLREAGWASLDASGSLDALAAKARSMLADLA